MEGERAEVALGAAGGPLHLAQVEAEAVGRGGEELGIEHQAAEQLFGLFGRVGTQGAHVGPGLVEHLSEVGGVGVLLEVGGEGVDGGQFAEKVANGALLGEGKAFGFGSRGVVGNTGPGGRVVVAAGGEEAHCEKQRQRMAEKG